jgi:ectoine hydroxylase-related dioxygenase (phytanoyl-CoA dioxygenase family)
MTRLMHAAGFAPSGKPRSAINAFFTSRFAPAFASVFARRRPGAVPCHAELDFASL